jgi:hypothetical protein
VALLVRRDGDDSTGPRYCYVSSTRHGGPGPGAPAHVPIGVVAPAELVRVTEGVLKADVTAALSGVPTVGTAGLAWRPVLSILRELGARTIRLALDADARDKAPVARALAACAEVLTAEELVVELERWPAPHKGIDDALAAGAAVEVLTGEAARQAIAEIVGEGTATEPPQEPGPLDRLADVLADGPEALFRDNALLRALAAVAEGDAAEFACRRAQLQRARIKLKDLDAALSPHRQAIRAERPPVTAAGEYRVSAGRIVHLRPTRDGPVEAPLCNFSGRIVEQVTLDDGAERSIRLAVEGTLHDGTPLPRTDVPADRFATLDWIVPSWGTGAVVYAGAGTRDHLRAALQLLSREVRCRMVYGHLGWREIAGSWYYLHAGGSIGMGGPDAGVEVSLPGALVGFKLPAPPAGEVLARATRASLALFDGLAPDRLAFPLLAAVYRAALGDAPGVIDLSLHLAGPHAAGKSELAALAVQHYGAGMDARHLPGSWSSTANALEALAFAAKDALFVVDDFAPRGAVGDRQRLEGLADRLLRAQGNHSGRQRMRADGSLRPERPPRGLILSTGEDVPSGQSLRGRLLVLEVSPGEVPLARLTPHQRAAADGLYAQALTGFVGWLALRYGELRDSLPAQRAALRDRALAEAPAGSPRTAGVVADLALGLGLFLDFARSAGVLGVTDRVALEARGWAALLQAAAAQAEHVQTAEPTALFLRLLAAAVGSGRAHVVGAEGLEPRQPAAWGWYGHEEQVSREEVVIRWRHQGRRVGWVDDDDLYLEPEASYAAAHELARDQGEGLPVSPRILHRRLRERGLLVRTEPGREVLTVRRTLEGRRRAVLHLRADALSPGQPDQPDQAGKILGEGGRIGGRVVGQEGLDPTTNPTSKPDQNGRENGPLVGLVRSDNRVGDSPQDDGEESVNPPGRGDAWEGD